MWEKDTFRLPVGADFVILGRRAIADTWRFPRMELDSAARRALLAFRGLVEQYESEAIRWLRGTVDLSFDPLTDSCLPANFHGHLGGHSWSVYESWLQELDRRVEMGWVVVTVERRPAIARDAPTFPEFPKPPPPRPESSDTFFDVRFVDETGQAINGLAVEFEAASDLHTATTNPAGVALLEHVVATSATVTIRDPISLEKILDPRWQKPRNQRAQKRANTTEFVFDGAELPPVSVKPVAEHTVVIKPPLGRLFVELWDKSGRVCHAARDYTISGPMQFSGTTDEQGRLSHDDVFPG
ncbi:MAG TPA: hypothetical protein VHU80_16375, partial [Polyangiaceae bacterium]|nr:hypothetical protein [Polyangiaceae bacterium]